MHQKSPYCMVCTKEHQKFPHGYHDTAEHEAWLSRMKILAEDRKKENR